jgi:histo-blood group ABO system transferase
MRFEGMIGDEILPKAQNEGLVATAHPGFYTGGGSFCDDKRSTAYTAPELRGRYYAGGFQGGRTEDYLEAALFMAGNIQQDEDNGVMAEWHDEMHWNRLCALIKSTVKELSPSYCMVEQKELRSKWGIDHLPVKLVALAKNHEEMRS